MCAGFKVLFKAVYHWLYHTKDEKNVHCSGRIVDCSVFAPRDDASFNLNLLRKEMKTREAQYVGKIRARGLPVRK